MDPVAAAQTPAASRQGSSARPRWLVYAQITLLLCVVALLLGWASRRAQRALPSRRRLQFQGLPLAHANGSGKGSSNGKAPASPRR